MTPLEADLAASLRRLHDILEAFVGVYDIPRTHPDAELILTECRKAFDALKRAEESR